MLKTSLLFSVVILFVFAIFVTSETLEEFNIIRAKVAQNCKSESNATDKDIKDMLAYVPPTTLAAKCLNQCHKRNLGVMRNRKLVPYRLVKLYEDVKTNGKDGKMLKDLVKDIGDACDEVTDTCESAHLVVACLNAEAKKRGFDDNVF